MHTSERCWKINFVQDVLRLRLKLQAELMALSGMSTSNAERDPDEECERFIMNALVQSSSLVLFEPFLWKVMEPKMLCFQNSSVC